ncbi:MAG: type III-B CRISPR module RAMP protein Cmr1 [Puniceicoccales bacterium]|jgi:hypothetical protein|nr:type III-B CRISPR module RAMP protein Cmr1 [Puniceicoccales bacterium]
MNRAFKITFITPCFCRGADCSETGEPEIRPPSIRGQLHWWFRATGGIPADENVIFGSVHGGQTASPVVVRVRAPLTPQTVSVATLPHKSGGPAAPKKALAAGSSFDLLISTRLGGLKPELEKKFNRALEAWLLMGALGLRATRAGGNFIWEERNASVPLANTDKQAVCPTFPYPATPATYEDAIARVTTGTTLRATLLNSDYTTAEAARRDITDTLSHAAFAAQGFPLGAVKQGGKDTSGAPIRKTSPLRFRVVKFPAATIRGNTAAGATFRILAIWDGRQQVTGNTQYDLSAAIEQLATANKPIGALLSQRSLF